MVRVLVIVCVVVGLAACGGGDAKKTASTTPSSTTTSPERHALQVQCDADLAEVQARIDAIERHDGVVPKTWGEIAGGVIGWPRPDGETFTLAPLDQLQRWTKNIGLDGDRAAFAAGGDCDQD